ncbi:rhamnosyltransferase|uniref:glycosyltransferase n=1 Tax=Brenneria salicis TaxID=55214 RepID=UPI000DE93228|nr:glycosyltransferase [Brenneria salicis]NMN92135.1 rhamnosyltransferase [Brenneria salicis ATCC 15712 = DSM 30166]RLM29821.1 rhamnosyltransferase [Brenneria salicis ATCC 15712 = DSM 30166]
MDTLVFIPTYNASSTALWHELLRSLKVQSIKPALLQIVDSESSDSTREDAEQNDFNVIKIHKKDFNHGGTRNMVLDLSEENDAIVIFLTQDAILNRTDALEKIVGVFFDPQIAIAYGRQLPHLDANPLAAHARYFNYKKESYTSDLSSKKILGIKTVFTSNSFAAYRLSILKALGGFPTNTILSEDMYLAAKAVSAGYKIAYVADSEVRHSHNYTPVEEFKRYFDIGVFHHDHSWIGDQFGGVGGEGMKFIFSEIKYLSNGNLLWIPRALIHNFLKILGYKLGQQYTKIPESLVVKMSMHKGFWKRK